MRAFEENAEHLTESFPKGCEDEEWMPKIGADGRILITRDDRIRWSPAQMSLLRRSKVGAFFLGGKNRSRCEIIQQLVRNWPRMKDLASRTPRPFAFRVPPKGTALDPLSVENLKDRKGAS